MSDISNRTIVALLAVALVVSVAGTMYSVSELGQVSTVFRLMGAVVDDDTGNVTLNISEVAGLVVNHKSADFGTGAIEAGANNHCAMRTGGSISGTSSSWSNNATYADNPGAAVGINMAHDGENLGDQNAFSANCRGAFNDSANLQDVFHVLENTGNVPLSVDAEWDNMYDAVGQVNAWNNSCAFLTGIDDDDGTAGCQDGTGQATDTNVPVRFSLMGLALQTHANKTYVETTYSSVSGATEAAVSTPSGAGFIANLQDGGQQFIPHLKYEDDRDEAVVGFGVIIFYNVWPGQRKAIIRYTGNLI